MRICIDISQIVYDGTGVARYMRELVSALLAQDPVNEYILFGSSFRKSQVFLDYYMTLRDEYQNVRLIVLRIPPRILEILWNYLHIIPIEWYVGNVDLVFSSDWMQPPVQKAKCVTTIHDMTVYTMNDEMARSIVTVQKRRLYWVKKQCERILCDSNATKRDIEHYLQIDPKKLVVVYPGYRNNH